jgi:hypothetical protein
MSQRDRIAGVISGLLMVIGVLLVWIDHYVLLRDGGVILFAGAFIYLTITLLRGPSRRNSRPIACGEELVSIAKLERGYDDSTGS